MSNALNWFEIPVTDLARAKAFYGRMLQIELRDETMGGVSMAILPYADGGVGGSLIVGEPHVPSTQGTIVYLGAGDDLGGTLTRAEAGGGKVLMGATRTCRTTSAPSPSSGTPRATGWACTRRGRGGPLITPTLFSHRTPPDREKRGALR
jgi:predicted enzyme related to lactoylglutathione lyase